MSIAINGFKIEQNVNFARPRPIRIYYNEEKNLKPQNDTIGGLIVGGKTIDISEAPWQVAVISTYSGYYELCGGSIIGASKILTAA